MSTLRKDFRSLDAEGNKTRVEKDADGVPISFCIWKSGNNETDHGPTIFSEMSAQLLLEEQEKRGNRYSIDIDHASLDPMAPITNHEAVGWFSIDVIEGDLWAVEIEWVNPTIVDGLKRGAWKYFSPAYCVNDLGEVVSLINCALTANPATWNVTALASKTAGIIRKEPLMVKATQMSMSELYEALNGDDDEKKEMAMAQMKAAAEDESKKEEEKGEEPKSDSEEDPDDDGDKDEKKEDSRNVDASVIAALAAKLDKVEADNKKFKDAQEAAEKTALIASKEMNTELSTILASKDLAYVKEICAALPDRKESKSLSRTTVTIKGTKGSDPNEVSRAARTDQYDKLVQKAGLSKKDETIHWERNTRVYPAQVGVNIAKGIK